MELYWRKSRRGLDLIVHEGGRQSDADKVLVGESVDQARARGTRWPANQQIRDHWHLRGVRTTH